MSRAIPGCKGFVGRVLLGLAIVMLPTGCRSKVPTPATGPLPRIVALSPALGATLHDYALDSLVVGRHAFDLALDPGVPVCGETVGGQIDYEAIVAAQPTAIFAQFGAAGIPPRLAELAGARKWKISRFEPLSLADVRASALAMIEELGTSGVTTDAARAAIARLEASLAPRSRAAGAGRVLLLASLRPIAAFGPGSLHHDILIAIGGTPAIAAGGAYQSLDAEDVIALKPDAIVVVEPRARHA
ncbi:MAG: ABC transporter substrate-binding protein, partial [Planctomycetota bacterium]